MLLLDIHLEDGTGFQLIERAGLTLPIIFTTAFDAYTLQAFKTNSVDYLLKPVDPDELAAALAKFRARHLAPAPDLAAVLRLLGQLPASGPLPAPVYKQRFLVSSGPRLRSIEPADVAYFFLRRQSYLTHVLAGPPRERGVQPRQASQTARPGPVFPGQPAFSGGAGGHPHHPRLFGGKLKLDLLPPPRQEVFVRGDRVHPFKEWLGK